MTRNDMKPDEPQHPPESDTLDRVLSGALRRPALPAGFHAALLERLAREQAQDLQERQRRLALERDQALRDLRSGYLRMRQDTLITIVALAFTAGAAATVALPALAQWTGTDLATAAIWTGGALALGAAAAAIGRRTRLLD